MDSKYFIQNWLNSNPPEYQISKVFELINKPIRIKKEQVKPYGYPTSAIKIISPEEITSTKIQILQDIAKDIQKRMFESGPIAQRNLEIELSEIRKKIHAWNYKLNNI